MFTWSRLLLTTALTALVVVPFEGCVAGHAYTVAIEDYVLFNTSFLSWQDATKACACNGGILAHFPSLEQYRKIVSDLELDEKDQVWFGLKRSDHQQQFSWSNGAELPWKNDQWTWWGLGEPFRSEEQCVLMTGEEGAWMVEDCSKKHMYLCFYPKPAISNIQSAQGFGDPHMVGFDGTSFEFAGMGGSFFNLLTESEHQVNVLFDSMGMRDATFMKALGIKYQNSLWVAVGSGIATLGDGNMKGELLLQVNGDAVHLSRPTHIAMQFEGGALLSATVKHDGRGRLRIATPLLVLDVLLGSQALHLDFQISVRKRQRMHGIIGQTIGWGEHDSMFDDLLEGDELEYMVSGLFADDFDFNLFGSTDTNEDSEAQLLEQNSLQLIAQLPLLDIPSSYAEAS